MAFPLIPLVIAGAAAAGVVGYFLRDSKNPSNKIQQKVYIEGEKGAGKSRFIKVLNGEYKQDTAATEKIVNAKAETDTTIYSFTDTPGDDSVKKLREQERKEKSFDFYVYVFDATKYSKPISKIKHKIFAKIDEIMIDKNESGNNELIIIGTHRDKIDEIGARKIKEDIEEYADKNLEYQKRNLKCEIFDLSIENANKDTRESIKRLFGIGRPFRMSI